MEVVWAVVTEPEHVSGWFSDSAELDLRPGGTVALHWDGQGTAHGRVERVEPPRFFSFRWMVRQGPEFDEDNSTLVEFSLREEGDATRLTVVESGFADPSEDRQIEGVDFRLLSGFRYRNVPGHQFFDFFIDNARQCFREFDVDASVTGFTRGPTRCATSPVPVPTSSTCSFLAGAARSTSRDATRPCCPPAQVS